MARKPLALAKLSRPRQPGVLARPRLFALIDEARAARALWIAGPPGSGKTTLAASYLDARRLSGIWYHVDAGDSDPATFFYYLGRAAGGRLPLLKPEYQKDLPGFARRFFRELFESADEGWTLVLDNYHELDPVSATHAMLRCAVGELPEGTNLVVISRDEPLQEFSPLIAARQLRRIDWREMAFDLDETRAFADLRGAKASADALHERAGGWAAGLVLLTGGRSRENASASVTPEAVETLFAYFAEEIVDKADASLREFLMLTAFLPRLTEASAAAVSGNPRAAKLLAELYRGHLFVDRREEQGAVYQYHDLFREFLLQRARETYPADRIATIQQQAARVLELAGQIEDAVPMYIAAGDAAAATALIGSHAQQLIAQGRGQTLRGWISSLPKAHEEVEPVLAYLFGLSLVPTDQTQARRHLERAYAGYAARGDVGGQILSAAGIINATLLEYVNFPALDRWIEAIERFIPHEVERLSARDQLHVYCSLFAAFVQRRPRHPLLPLCRDRTRSLIEADVDPNLRVTAGCYLIHYCNLAGGPELRRSVVRTLTPLLRDPTISALNKATWLARLAFNLMTENELGPARQAAHEARAIALAHGFGALAGYTVHIEFCIETTLGNLAAADRCLELFHSPEPSDPTDVAVWHIGRTARAYARGDIGAALGFARTLVASAERGASLLPKITGLSLLSVLLAEAGNFDEAEQQLRQALERYGGAPLSRANRFLRSARAYTALLRGELPEAHEALRELLVEARQQGTSAPPFGALRFMRRVDVRLLEAALRAGIEVEYLRDYIRSRGLTPDSADVPHWPWPLRIRTLGRFEVTSDDKPVGTGQKAQRKPLELLGALVARGGRDVPAATIAADLWPDAEGDAGQASFEASLHRLRKLIGQPDAIQLHDGKLSLDSRRCWVDVWTFERLCGAADHAAIDLYAGQFLASEPERPWMLAARERLRGRFIRLSLQLGEQAEGNGDETAAKRLYERALEIDNLAEPVYQRLMRCHMRSGQRAEAMRLYRRCRELLEIGLGVPPAPETQALYNELRAAESEIR
jgi:DNA-binding SARP family transcriptional activator